MAVTKYLEIYNADNILIIDDTFQNLTLKGGVYANGYVKCTQKSDFDAKKLKYINTVNIQVTENGKP
ncbi:hypothetical protein [Phascolarctobacterium succinatutens]|uniref:hypothetical protein n=1 Tax=Phascolarctobacterium succinatutens TaxID=626940 RepID=UPI0026EBBFA0|nr:hypothetical protein [Phascolarctobacterium succinatutens]